MTRVLIIEDEAKAARELERMLKQIDSELEIVANLDSVELSRKWFTDNKTPDLIFSDIHLADGLCFDIFDGKTDITSPVIFCTAFDEYLMHAFETNAVSYLLKPITRQKLEKALDKFHSFKSAFEKPQSNTGLPALINQFQNNYKTALLVHQKEKIIPVQIKDIAFFYFTRLGLNIHTFSNQKYYLATSLDEIEKTIDPGLFYRANRQFLINKLAITNAERFFARKLIAKLNVATPETIVISKAKASDFLHWIES